MQERSRQPVIVSVGRHSPTTHQPRRQQQQSSHRKQDKRQSVNNATVDRHSPVSAATSQASVDSHPFPLAQQSRHTRQSPATPCPSTDHVTVSSAESAYANRGDLFTNRSVKKEGRSSPRPPPSTSSSSISRHRDGADTKSIPTTMNNLTQSSPQHVMYPGHPMPPGFMMPPFPFDKVSIVLRSACNYITL